MTTSKENDAARLVSAEIVGLNIRTVIVNSEAYVIHPPTIARLMAATFYLTDIRDAESLADMLRGLNNLGSLCKALSIFITGDETIADKLGEGTIDGSGQLWRPIKQLKMTQRQWDALLKKSEYTVTEKDGQIWLPTKTSYDGWNMSKQKSPELESLDTAQKYWDFFRPVMVRLYKCDHILVEDVTLQNSPAWNLHPCFCQHVTIKNASIRNPYYAQNGDGLDLESCQYAEITGTTFDVGDDAICMKSGKGQKARKIKVPTEYVRISDCTVYHGHGGFVVGSEMSRGVRNVEVKNCTFIGTDVGIRFKSAIGRGGVVEDITLDGIQMINIEKEAIIFTMGYVLDYRESEEKSAVVKADDIPYFKNITLRNITCSGAEYGLKAEGIDLNAFEIVGENDGQPVIDNIVIEDSAIIANVEKKITNCGKIVYMN